MAYKHIIRAKTKNLMTDEMFTSAGFTKQPDGSWYVPDSVVLNNKVMWENTEGIAGPITMSFYGKSSAPYYAGVVQWLVEEIDGTITYRTPVGTSSEWVYGTWSFDSKTVSKVYWVNIANRPLYLRDVMFEWGSTPTPYTPYNYLQSNKRMGKVSDVCQLYAKNIWREGNFYGVSIKNNNDGSITLNGTATETFYYTNRLDYEIKPNHKYLYFDHYPQTPSWESYIGGCEGKVNHESEVKFAVYSLNKDGTIDSSSPNLPSNTLLNTFCMVYKGFTLNNITIKPQLFDLTEMYGAGHEPATVAEFRQRFPNELYPYSPQCWLTSYKSAIVCKTKNLFDFANIQLSDAEMGNGNYIEKFSSGVIIQGAVGETPGVPLWSNGWFQPGFATLSSRVILSSGNIITVSFDYIMIENLYANPVRVMLDLHSQGGESNLYYFDNIEIGKKYRLSHTFTIQNDGEFYPIISCSSGKVLIQNIQIEQGSTATSYVPYQHL